MQPGLHISSCASSQIARDTFRLIYELLSYLLETAEVGEHAQRSKLERCVNCLMEECREYVFANHPVNAPSSHAVKVSLLPESAVADELIFLRVVQRTELVFHTATLLTARAVELIAYSDVAEAMVALHWVVRLESLLLPLLRLLSPMSVEHWLEIRPLIVKPSAIQSVSFHHLNAYLSELARILDHPRFPEWQQRYLPLATTC